MKFTVQVKQHTGMVAIGFPKDAGLMINADAVIGMFQVNNETYSVKVGVERLPLSMIT